MPALLPLFPLSVVVFPRTRLPLHIFEDRYKEMISEAVRDNSEFGIVLARENGVLNTGCTVIVADVLRTLDDGRMDILTSGVRRFEIVALDNERSFLRGEVTFFDDEDTGPVPTELRLKALESYRDWLTLGEPAAGNEAMLADPQVSFQIAQGIDDTEFRQSLLSVRSEQERLRLIVQFLGHYIPRRRKTEQVKKVAPLNGHGPHPPGL